MGGGTIKEAKIGPVLGLFRGIGWLMVHTVHRPKLCGSKPALDKPTIFAIRHVGLIDPVILMSQYPYHLLHPLVAVDYYEKNAFTRFFYPAVGCIPIDRKNSSREWMDHAGAALDKGESIVIAPEGKRNKTGEGLLPFKCGAAYLAAHTGAQIIPVYNKFWKFPRRYRLAIGNPVQLDPVPEDGPTSEWAHAQTDRIRQAVAALAPLVGD